MSNKQFKSALRRLRNGIKIFIKDGERKHRNGVFKVEFDGRVYRGTVISTTDFGDPFVEMIYEVPSLDWLRRIVVHYYPAVSKAIGSARKFSGV